MISKEEKFVQVSFAEVVRKLWPVIRKYGGALLFGVALILSTTAIEIILPILVGKVVDSLVHGPISHWGIGHWCGGFLLLVFLKALLDAAQAYAIQSTGQKITHDLRCMLFQHIGKLPVAYFDRNPTGRLLTRVVNDIKSLSELFTASISVLALDIMVITGTIIAMFWLNFRLACYVLITFPLVVLSVRYFGSQLSKTYRVVRLKLSEMNAFLGENVGAIATIQRLAAEKERFQKFGAIVEAHKEAQLRSVKMFSLVQPVANVLNGVAIATLLVVGGKGVLAGTLSVGVVVAFLGYLRNIFQPIRDLVEKYNTFLSALVSAERVIRILDEPAEGSAVTSVAEASPPKSVFVVPPSAWGIEFKDVWFRYPQRQELALKAVSFDVAPGTQTAIVGATGSGKSTLIRLLMRFYEPERGEILLAGRSIREWNRDALRRSVGVIHQDLFLFQGTIRDNLTLGRPGFDDAFLIRCCERVQLWEHIRHRGGLNMVVFEGGANLSLGERQLISFARILIFDSPVLVLDEATASVDRILEKRLMEAVREVISRRTSIVIAHRLSTVLGCHKLVVLQHGELVEQGTLDELMAREGIFHRYFQLHAQSPTV